MGRGTQPRLVLELSPAQIAAIQAPILARLAALEARLGAAALPETAGARPWVSVPVAARLTGIAPSTLRQYIREGRVPGIHAGQAYRVSAAWVAGQQRGA